MEDPLFVEFFFVCEFYLSTSEVQSGCSHVSRKFLSPLVQPFIRYSLVNFGSISAAGLRFTVLGVTDSVALLLAIMQECLANTLKNCSICRRNGIGSYSGIDLAVSEAAFNL
jgi:hypothetical protein